MVVGKLYNIIITNPAVSIRNLSFYHNFMLLALILIQECDTGEYQLYYWYTNLKIIHRVKTKPPH